MDVCRAFGRIAVGCALAAQLRAREKTWRGERATYVDLGHAEFREAGQRQHPTRSIQFCATQ